MLIYHGPNAGASMVDEHAKPIARRKGLLTALRGAATHVVVVICMLVFGVFAIGIGRLLITGNNPAGRDIVSFWAAGQLIAHHANPYDASAVVAMERAAGSAITVQPFIMRNPPTSLVLVLPLGWLGLHGASVVWSVLMLASLAFSVYLLHQLLGRPVDRNYLLGCSFGPALVCILCGQTAVFALLGLVLFLRLNRSHGFYAGVALWLCALKPHLFLPFAALLSLWIVDKRRYRVIAGAGLALAASSIVAMHFDMAIWTQYAEMMRAPEIRNEFIPCLGVALRLAIHPRVVWLQYLPAAVGCIWAVWFYMRHRAVWDWMVNGALLMLVSLLVSPYSWLTDQAVLLPALLGGAYLATTRTQLAALAVVSAAIEIAQLAGKDMHSALYAWLPLFWLAWFLYVSMRRRTQSDHSTAAPDIFAGKVVQPA